MFARGIQSGRASFPFRKEALSSWGRSGFPCLLDAWGLRCRSHGHSENWFVLVPSLLALTPWPDTFFSP